jgi:competence protein ComEC
VKSEISVPGRWCLLAGSASWCGVVVGFSSVRFGALATATLVLTALAMGRLSVNVAVVFAVLGIVSGVVAGGRVEAIEQAVVPQGSVLLVVRVAEEASGTTYSRAVGKPISVDGGQWNGPRIALIGLDPSIPVGATVTVEGDLRRHVTRVRDEIVAGVLRIERTLDVHPSINPIVRVGNAIRGRVTAIYDGSRSGDGLVRGLLIGDTDLLPAGDEEDLRRAGLAHFIAVSGSNVAMFLVAWWFLTAPIAVRPIPRVVGGLVGLAVFAVVTRWEPSVIRASVMAAVPLFGGLVGIPFDPWMALGSAVTFLLLISGQLAFSVGFQLSVAATAGVLVGVAAARDRSPGWLYVPLFATMGAQATVAPIILIVFGSVPLLAPVANLIVAPIVAVTTAIGSLALVFPPLALAADVGASMILAIATLAATGPQLGWAGTLAAGVVGGAVAWRASRPLGIAAVLLVIVAMAGTTTMWPAAATMVVLDIGQGDAILLQDPSGQTILVDGGPDPRSLDRALRRNGVKQLDLVVVTHGDLDHVGGVTELLASGRVAELWVPNFMNEEGLLGEAIDTAESAGVPVMRVATGMVRTTRSFRLEVLGPRRKYQAENDGSVILLASAGGTALLGGDIEAVAQSEMPDVMPDVIVVPHHGSGTTDTGWLSEVVGAVAVLSYGRNSYGHPHPDVLDTLERAGTDVHHTYLEGDVSIDLASMRGRQGDLEE